MAKETTPGHPVTELNEIQRYVTQKHGTEPPFTGRLLHNKREGVYHCLGCDASRCSIPKPNTIRAAAGRAFMSR